MDFQIKSLPKSMFEHLFSLSDEELAAQNAVKRVVASRPGTPCRVSMRDADIGETVILVNYQHQPAASPYQASHGIFIRENAEQAHLGVNEVPQVIRSRLVSLRCFDKDHMIIHADVIQGDDLAQAISTAFGDPKVAYAHIHNAKPGCFAASVERVA